MCRGELQLKVLGLGMGIELQELFKSPLTNANYPYALVASKAFHLAQNSQLTENCPNLKFVLHILPSP